MSTAQMQAQFIEIGLRQEHYAIRIETIQEIIRMQLITEVPGCGRDIQGVINLRGRIVPVVDLHSQFGWGGQEPTPFTRIVVVNSGQETVGFIVDRVYRVTSYSKIQPPPEGHSGVGTEFVTGIGHSDDHLVSIMNLDSILQQGGV